MVESIIDISELIHIGESLTLEYKSSFDRELIETLVAFANAKCGTGVGPRQPVKLTLLFLENSPEYALKSVFLQAKR